MRHHCKLWTTVVPNIATVYRPTSIECTPHQHHPLPSEPRDQAPPPCFAFPASANRTKNFSEYPESTNSSNFSTLLPSSLNLSTNAYSLPYGPITVSDVLDACIMHVRASTSWTSVCTVACPVALVASPREERG
jgi:hypothetical protein